MSKKVIAYYRTEGRYRTIDIFRAIKLENNVIKNRDKHIAFWDSPDESISERMHTVRTSKNGRGAHFSYYPHSTRVGVGGNMSATHRLYCVALSEEKVLELYQFGERIKIYIDSANPDVYYRTKYNQYYLDVMLILEKTEPSSYFYKWGGKLVIEVWCSHKVDKSKANDLEENGLQIFELKVYQNQRIPHNIGSEKEYNYYKYLISERVKQDKLVGRLINDVIPETGTLAEERYTRLAEYEKEIANLKKEIEYNEIKLKEQRDKINQEQSVLNHLMQQHMIVKAKMEKISKTIGNVDNIINSRNQYESMYQKEKEKRLQVEDELKMEREKSIFSILLTRLIKGK